MKSDIGKRKNYGSWRLFGGIFPGNASRSRESKYHSVISK
jgi:hypothetical protein